MFCLQKVFIPTHLTMFKGLKTKNNSFLKKNQELKMWALGSPLVNKSFAKIGPKP